MRKVFVCLSVMIFLLVLTAPSSMMYCNVKVKTTKWSKWFDTAEEEEDEEGTDWEEKFCVNNETFMELDRKGMVLVKAFGDTHSTLPDGCREQPTPPPRTDYFIS